MRECSRSRAGSATRTTSATSSRCFAQHRRQLAPGGGASPRPRRARRRGRAGGPEPGASGPTRAAEAREVFAVIAGLRDVFRDALVAVDVVGLTYAEAAELLGTKEATITSRVFRGRAQVARGMESGPEGVRK